MRCTAYPFTDAYAGWLQVTFCGKKVSGAIAKKLDDCKMCSFDKRVAVQKDA